MLEQYFLQPEEVDPYHQSSGVNEKAPISKALNTLDSADEMVVVVD